MADFLIAVFLFAFVRTCGCRQQCLILATLPGTGPRRQSSKAGSTPSSVFAPSSDSFLLLVARPGAPSVASLLLVAMPGAPSSFLLLVVRPGALVASLLLVAMPGAPSSFLLLVYSKARSP